MIVFTQKLVLAALLWQGLTVNAAMAQSPAKQQSASAPQCTPSKGNGAKAAEAPVAIAAGQPISERDLDDAVAPQIVPLRNQEYQIKSKVLEDLIRQRLVEAEAKKRGLTVDQLYVQEVDSKIPTATEGEINAYYLALKSQIKTPLQEIKTQLQTNLKALQTRQARQDTRTPCVPRRTLPCCCSPLRSKSHLTA
jgi:hypothetical protein